MGNDSNLSQPAARAVELVAWPAEGQPDSRSPLCSPRLLVVQRDADPPLVVDPLEDWVYENADAGEVAARIARLQLRSDMRRVFLDRDGRLHTSTGWVALSPLQAALMTELVEHFGSVVTRDALLDAGWPINTPVIGNNLEVQLSRLRFRIRQVRLSLRTVRSCGYVVDHLREPAVAVVHTR